jgi:mannan endo-1,4-beta-mannosidase
MGRIPGWLVGLVMIAPWPAEAQVYRFEAETGQMFGTHVSSAVPGYSGTGYVTGFTASGGSPPHYFQLQVDVPQGV